MADKVNSALSRVYLCRTKRFAKYLHFCILFLATIDFYFLFIFLESHLCLNFNVFCGCVSKSKSWVVLWLRKYNKCLFDVIYSSILMRPKSKRPSIKYFDIKENCKNLTLLRAMLRSMYKFNASKSISNCAPMLRSM